MATQINITRGLSEVALQVNSDTVHKPFTTGDNGANKRLFNSYRYHLTVM